MNSQPPFPKKQKKRSAYSGDVTQRDMDVLRQIGEQTAYRFDQLPGLLARHPDSRSGRSKKFSEGHTWDILRHWQQLGLADYRKKHLGTYGWIWLTRKGLRTAHVHGQSFEPPPDLWDSLYWINETRALIEDTYDTYAGFSWESKRSLRTIRERWQVQQKENPSLAVPTEYQGQYEPDALLRYKEETDIGEKDVISAIEIVLAGKSYVSWKKLFLDLLTHYTNAHLFTCPPAKSSLVKAMRRFQCEPPQLHEPSLERRQNIYIHDLEKVL